MKSLVLATLKLEVSAACTPGSGEKAPPLLNEPSCLRIWGSDGSQAYKYNNTFDCRSVGHAPTKLRPFDILAETLYLLFVLDELGPPGLELLDYPVPGGVQSLSLLEFSLCRQLAEGTAVVGRDRSGCEEVGWAGRFRSVVSMHGENGRGVSGERRPIRTPGHALMGQRALTTGSEGAEA